MYRGEGTNKRDAEDVTQGIKLEDLFDSTRILMKPKLYKAILYFPFGLLLLLLRIVICFVGILTLSFLPKTSYTRSVLLKGMCKVLGLVVEVDGKYLDDTTKLVIANHVSILDRLAVNVMVPCNIVSQDFQIKNMDALLFWKDDVKYPRSISNDEISALKSYVESSSTHVLSFPEGTTTNGKVGLLKFHPEIFSLNSAVQPVLIFVSMSSFMTISPSAIGNSVFGDILWAFFLPCTSFTLKVLPSIVKLPEESVEEYSKRVQEAMANVLNVAPTIYTSVDKAELSKRLKTTSNIAPRSIATTRLSAYSDKFPPLNQIIGVTPNPSLSMNTAAKSFGKTPRERMSSYQERRAKLIEAAKMKYIQKQNVY